MVKKHKDKTEEEILNDGIEAMVHSFMHLIEPCIRQRCQQIMTIVADGFNENKRDSNNGKKQSKFTSVF